MLGDLQHYWSGSFLAANAFIGLNMVGALLLGMLVGYERSYNGRAAGMRTYGLVCMASTALTVFVGHASLWYGGATAHIQADPTHTIQGVVTGVGFLCAGVIMKDGMRIRGLTTAAYVGAADQVSESPEEEAMLSPSGCGRGTLFGAEACAGINRSRA
ncbi:MULTISPECIES: MgtC/SapB family protein [Cupriavidus]|uniref:MgtC/SapB family protein n=1 Tax=Cupriavidus sp. SK-3 TaxID=1470558 RepID=UPI00045150C1|nr:hypothetical protein CF70_008480 [Cupriavidus sp. SK-3]